MVNQTLGGSIVKMNGLGFVAVVRTDGRADSLMGSGVLGLARFGNGNERVSPKVLERKGES